MKITFLEDYTVKDDSGTAYKKGQAVDLEDPSARHFINKGVAIEAQDAPKTAAKPKSK